MLEEKLESGSSDESNGIYPSSFKNTFWKELEAGRVDLFQNDMYSKVKAKRASTASNRRTDSSNNEDGHLSQSPTDERKSISSQKQTPSKTAHNAPTNTRSKSRKSSTLSEFSENRRNSVKFLSDSEGDENSDSYLNSLNTTDTDFGKPSLSFVIKKVSEITDEIDTQCSVSSPVPSPSYTLLPKTTDRKGNAHLCSKVLISI